MSNWKLEALVIERSDATGAAYAVAVAIAALGNRNDSDWADVSLDRITVVARCDRRTVSRAIDQLRAGGELEVQPGVRAQRGVAARTTRYRMRREVLEQRRNRLTDRLSTLTSSSGATPPLSNGTTPSLSNGRTPPLSSGMTPPVAAKRSRGVVPKKQGRDATASSGVVPTLLKNRDIDNRTEDSPHARVSAREGRGDASVDAYAEAHRAAGLGAPPNAELDLVQRKAHNLIAGGEELEDVLEACRRAAPRNEARFLDRLCGDAKRDRVGVRAPTSQRAQQQQRLFAEARRK